MKKKTVKFFTLLLVVLTLTGCTTQLKDNNKKAVRHPETGQVLTKNILCQPTDKQTKELYKKNKVKIEELPKCENFSVSSGGYEGIWATIFVKPLAYIIIKIGQLLKNYGLAIIVVTLLIRLVTIRMTKKAAIQSEQMKLAQPEIDKLEKKYKNKTDQDSSMKKNQELLMIYQKYKINPMAGCLFSLIQIPLFFAFYEALNRLPVVFEETFLIFQMGTTPTAAMTIGHFEYIIIVLLVIASSYFSFKLNSGASMSQEQAKQMKMMSNFMVLFIGIASLSLSTGLALYWITNSSFTIIQNLVVKRRKENVKNA